jgi:hypothetical protein
MSIIFGILEEEGERLKEVIELYGDKIKELPKGSLWFKKRNGRKYAYLAFRESKKVKFKYIAPVPSQKYEDVSLQVKKRKEYEERIRNMKKDLSVIQRTMKNAGTK